MTGSFWQVVGLAIYSLPWFRSFYLLFNCLGLSKCHSSLTRFFALTQAGAVGYEAEIFLYDTLPGGAGFSPQIKIFGESIFRKTLEILDDCPDNCDRSCYRCLRSYKNKFDHSILDRQIAATLLRYLLDGEVPPIDNRRLEYSTQLLYEDLDRQGFTDLNFLRNETIDVTGIGQVNAPILAEKANGEKIIIVLFNALTPDYVDNKILNDVKEYSTDYPVIPVDELLVRHNLPTATYSLLDRIR